MCLTVQVVWQVKHCGFGPCFKMKVVKGIKDGRKKIDTFRLKFYFGGLRLFFDDECFPELVEMIVLPYSKRLIYIMKSS